MTMTTQRRKFSAQYKSEAVELVILTGKSIKEVADELGINPGTLGNWVSKYNAANPEPEKPMTPRDHAYLSEVEAENRRLKMENEFLKKAAAFFARTQD